MTYLQRKKLAFMSIVNSVKGFVRKVSGIPPLTLSNCVDAESMIDYTIEGASGGVGDAVENLFDNKRKWDAKGSDAIPSYGSHDATYIDGGGYHMTAYDSILFNFTNLIVGETYTISWDLTTSHSGQNICLIVAQSSYKYKYYYSKGTTRFSQTFTATATTKIAFGFINQAQTVDGTADITNIMLVQGSTAKAYEPYGKFRLPIVCSDSITTNIYLDAPLEDGEVINYKEDNLPKLPTVQGTTIYTVETAVQPSNMIVTYYATAKE